MILHNDTISLGDTINTFRTCQALIKKFNIKQTMWTNDEVASLFPAHLYGVSKQKFADTTEEILTVSYHQHINGLAETDRNLDFEEAYAKKYDLNLEGVVTKLFMPEMEGPSYDILVAPQVLNNEHKNPRPWFYQALVDALHERYPDFSICVVGKSTIPEDAHLTKIEHNIEKFKESEFLTANTTQYLTGVEYFWDRSLWEVCQLIKNTERIFISPDSGLAWVNNFIKKPHVQLYGPPHRGVIMEHFPNRHDCYRVDVNEDITIELTMQHIRKAMFSL